MKTIHDPLIKSGNKVGVPYHFDKITRTPNSLDAHRLIRWALPLDKQVKVCDALFLAYWRDGKDVGGHTLLTEIAEAVGMDRHSIAIDLHTNKDGEKILAEARQAQDKGITGVPTFIINHKFGISGAQSAPVLAEVIRKIAMQRA